MQKELFWGLLRMEAILDARDARLKKESGVFEKNARRSQRLLLVVFALGAMLLAIQLEQFSKLEDVRNGGIGQLIEFIDAN